jgi:hypothetical protein
MSTGADQDEVRIFGGTTEIMKEALVKGTVKRGFACTCALMPLRG